MGKTAYIHANLLDSTEDMQVRENVAVLVKDAEYFHRYVGVPRAFALHSATLVNARTARIKQETGSIEPGKSADFLITKQNPLEDLRTLRTPVMVVMRGKPVRARKLKLNREFDRILDPVIL